MKMKISMVIFVGFVAGLLCPKYPVFDFLGNGIPMSLSTSIISVFLGGFMIFIILFVVCEKMGQWDDEVRNKEQPEASKMSWKSMVTLWIFRTIVLTVTFLIGTTF